MEVGPVLVFELVRLLFYALLERRLLEDWELAQLKVKDLEVSLSTHLLFADEVRALGVPG